MFHYIISVRRKPNTDTSDYQGLGTPDPHPTGHSLFKLGTETYHDARTVAPGYDADCLEQERRDMWVDSGKPSLGNPDKAPGPVHLARACSVYGGLAAAGWGSLGFNGEKGGG